MEVLQCTWHYIKKINYYASSIYVFVATAQTSLRRVATADVYTHAEKKGKYLKHQAACAHSAALGL